MISDKNRQFQQKIAFLSENQVGFCFKFEIHSLNTIRQTKTPEKAGFSAFFGRASLL
jgi:hypothetical protein